MRHGWTGLANWSWSARPLALPPRHPPRSAVRSCPQYIFRTRRRAEKPVGKPRTAATAGLEYSANLATSPATPPACNCPRQPQPALAVPVPGKARA